VYTDVEVNGRPRQVRVERANGQLTVEIDGRPWRVDAARIDGDTWSLILAAPGGAGGPSYEITVAPAAAAALSVRVGPTVVAAAVEHGRRRRRPAGDAGSGPQQVIAPMPGKIVRVLVAAGDAVAARQALVVVEAMKMENELRAERPGIVARVHVKDGASVEAGAPLIEIR
jgi:biotin carboxyl carrier protein